MSRSNYFILIIVWSSAMTNTWAQRCYPDRVTFSDEKAIDITGSIRQHEEAKLQEQQFATFFTLRDGTKLDVTPEVIPVGKLLEKFYFPIKEGMAHDWDCNNGKCLAGFMVDYGLVDNDLKLIFVAFYTRLQPRSTSDTLHYQWGASRPGWFVYEGSGATGNFVNVPHEQALEMVRRYEKNILKQPFPVEGTPAMPLADGFDMRRVRFSFQEIVRFYHMVHEAKPGRQYYCEELEFHHGCVYIKDRRNDQPSAKHSLFITKKGWSELSDKKSNENELKALAPVTNSKEINGVHVCLPSCDNFSYPAAH